jgi:hypothetical protein
MRGARGRPPGHSVSATSRLHCDTDETQGCADDQGEQRHAATRVGLTHRQQVQMAWPARATHNGSQPTRRQAHRGPSRRPRTWPWESLRARSEARDGQPVAPRGPTAERWPTPMPRTMPRRCGSARLVPVGAAAPAASRSPRSPPPAGRRCPPRSRGHRLVRCPVRAASRGPSGRCRSRRPGSTRRSARARSRCRRCREPGTSAWRPPRRCRRRARIRTRGRRCCP